jgi:hypothetical protein
VGGNAPKPALPVQEPTAEDPHRTVLRSGIAPGFTFAPLFCLFFVEFLYFLDYRGLELVGYLQTFPVFYIPGILFIFA